VLLLGLVAFCALRPIWNIDVGWHLAVGRWILGEGRLPDRDLWSAADPAAPWRSFQWLWQVGAAALERAGGVGLLRAAHALWVAASFGLGWVLLRRRGVGPATALLVLAALLVVWHDRLRVRPHVVNLTGMLLVTGAVLRPRWRLRTGFLAGAAGVWTWAALHMGGALLGAGALAWAALARVVVPGAPQTRAPARALSAAALGAVVGLALAPGALETVVVMVAQHRASMASIDEWRSWWQALPDLTLGRVQIAAVLTAWPVAAAAWLVAGQRVLRRVRSGRGGVIAVERAALAVVFLGASLLWVRFSWMAVLALAILAVHERERAVEGRVRFGAWRWVLGVALLGLSLHHTTLGSWSSVGQAVGARAQDWDERRFPVKEARLLALTGLDARVATPAGWGGYVLYAGWPRLRVTVDGRMVCPPEVLATTEAIREALETHRGIEALPALYDRLPADLLLMPAPAFPAGDFGDWLPVVRSSRADLFVRRGPHLDAWGPRFDEAFRRLQEEDAR